MITLFHFIFLFCTISFILSFTLFQTLLQIGILTHTQTWAHTHTHISINTHKHIKTYKHTHTLLSLFTVIILYIYFWLYSWDWLTQCKACCYRKMSLLFSVYCSSLSRIETLRIFSYPSLSYLLVVWLQRYCSSSYIVKMALKLI